MRKCPRCDFPLDEVTLDEIELDHCRRCGGTFLDPGEAAQILGATASPEVWKDSSLTRDRKHSRLVCPNDRTRFTTYPLEFEDQQMEVEVCNTCGGMWLDPQEGVKLRDLILEAGQSDETDFVPPEDRPGIFSYFFQLFSGIPLEVWNPVRKPATITRFLVGLLCAVFLAQIALGSQNLINSFGLYPNRLGGQWWGLLTAAFLHGGLIHILGNICFLYIFGDNVEDFLGKKRFLVLYFAALLAGSLLDAGFRAGSDTPSVGASGAVAGLLGAYLVLFPRVKLYVVLFYLRLRIGVILYLGFWIGYNLLMAYLGGQNVAWMAHVGGFAAGLLIALRYRVRPLIQQVQADA